MGRLTSIRRTKIALADLNAYVLGLLFRVAGIMLVFISAVYGCLELFGLLPELTPNNDATFDVDKAKELATALTPEDEPEEEDLHVLRLRKGC